MEEVDLGDGETIEVPMEGLECATVEAPLDYSDPDGEVIELFVSRRPAVAENAIGPLFVNQGGPGMPAAEYAASIGGFDGLDRFDIIGMDPRGTGRSTQLDCEVSLEHPPALVTDPEAEPTPRELSVQEDVEACAADPRLEFFGTNNAARDIDYMRELLGVEQITYHGKSYGSDLGTAYVSLFPDRVRAAVLDGATDFTITPVEFLVQQARAGDRFLERYLDRCVDESCEWTGGTDPHDAWAALRDRVSDEPITDPETGETLTVSELDALPGALVGAPAEEIDLVLTALMEGDISMLEDEFPDVEVATAFYAITCLDLPISDPGAAQERFLESGLEPTSDILDVFAYCGAWPAEDPVVLDEAAESGPVLVISTTGDVPTPYESGEGLAAALANAEMLTFEADVHTGYLHSECVREWADRLLVDLELPPVGTTCDDAP